MKDCGKKWQTNNTDSVIAKLMGIDGLPPKQPLRGKHRVLSDSYIRKAASIGLRPGSLVSKGRSCSANSDMLNGVKSVTDIQISKNIHDVVLDKNVNTCTSKLKMSIRSPKPVSASVSKSLSGSSYEGRKSLGKKGENCAPRNALRYLQKLDHGSLAGHFGELGIDYMNKSLKFQLEMINKSCLPNVSKRQKFERWKTAKEVPEIGVSGRGQTFGKMVALVDKKSMPRNLNLRLGRNGLCTPSSLQSRSSGSISPSTFSSIDVREEDYIKKLPVCELEVIKETLSSGWNLKQDESTARENKLKELTIQQKDILKHKDGKDCEQFQTSPGVNGTMSPSSKISELSSCYFSCFDSEYNNPETYAQGIQDEMDNRSENDRCRENELSQRVSKSSISNLASPYINDNTFASAETPNTEVHSRVTGDHLSESNGGILSGEVGHSSYVQEVFSGEDSSNEFSEEDSTYSSCSRIGPPEFQDNLKRTYQHSPDSVLEPYDIQNSSTFECFESIGLQLQLQALNFYSEETYSEGSVMVVSGDEDTEQAFSDHSYDGRKVQRWFGEDQSRNFSYLVDVLDEAGIFGMKSFMDFRKWHSLECPISPLVFEALEKKYGKQISWPKSERQLLFDRINSGLMSIFDPLINFHDYAMSIRRRFFAALRRDEVENELWKMLISQEKEKSRDLSEKALGKWLEFEEGNIIICREIETSLFDELVMELASL